MTKFEYSELDSAIPNPMIPDAFISLNFKFSFSIRRNLKSSIDPFTSLSCFRVIVSDDNWPDILPVANYYK